MYHIWDIDSLTFEELKSKFPQFIVENNEGASKAVVLEFLNNNNLLDTKVVRLGRILDFYNKDYKKKYGKWWYTGKVIFKTYFEWFQDYMSSKGERPEIEYYLNHLSNEELTRGSEERFVYKYSFRTYSIRRYN